MYYFGIGETDLYRSMALFFAELLLDTHISTRDISTNTRSNASFIFYLNKLRLKKKLVFFQQRFTRVHIYM